MEVALQCLDLFGVDRAKGSYVMTILVVRLLLWSVEELSALCTVVGQSETQLESQLGIRKHISCSLL